MKTAIILTGILAGFGLVSTIDYRAAKSQEQARLTKKSCPDPDILGRRLLSSIEMTSELPGAKRKLICTYKRPVK